MSTAEARISRLREALAARELGAVLVTAPANVRYLAGFTGTNGTLLIAPGAALLFTDFRYLEQAAAQSPEFAVVDGGGSPRERLADAIAAYERVGFDDADLRVKSHAGLLAAIDGRTELVAASGLVETLREVKDDDELAAIAGAAEIADSIYETLAEEGLVGRTEREVAWRIEVLARERGASGLSFDSIVAAGAHGALPHAEPRDVKIAKGELVVLDLGVVLDGYCSDCTRTFATGVLPDRQREVYEIVLQAQEAALAGVRAGADCRELDAIARDFLNERGVGEAFGHSLGHGVGIEVHEAPTLSTKSEGTLAAGNVVTVEPGVYFEGEFGIRIEDLAVVEVAGSRVLTAFPKKLVTVG